jgi:hypothetical protein
MSVLDQLFSFLGSAKIDRFNVPFCALTVTTNTLPKSSGTEASYSCAGSISIQSPNGNPILYERTGFTSSATFGPTLLSYNTFGTEVKPPMGSGFVATLSQTTLQIQLHPPVFVNHYSASIAFPWGPTSCTISEDPGSGVLFGSAGDTLITLSIGRWEIRGVTI